MTSQACGRRADDGGRRGGGVCGAFRGAGGGADGPGLAELRAARGEAALPGRGGGRLRGVGLAWRWLSKPFWDPILGGIGEFTTQFRS